MKHQHDRQLDATGAPVRKQPDTEVSMRPSALAGLQPSASGLEFT